MSLGPGGSVIFVVMAEAERQDLLLYLFQSQFVVITHPDRFLSLPPGLERKKANSVVLQQPK